MPKRKAKAEEASRIDPANQQTGVPIASATSPAQSNILNPQERRQKEEDILAQRREQEENLDIINRYFMASNGGSILDAEISGVHIDGNDACWLCHQGPITVKIPFKETFDVLPSELLDDNVTNIGIRRRQILSKSIGITINFVITKFLPDPADSKRAIVIASRVKALEKDRQRYFGPNAYKPVREGDKVKATFMSIGQHIAWINFKGMDVRVRAADLSHRYLPDLPAVYGVGEKIEVVVTKLKYPEGSKMPEIRVSARPLELEACKKNQGRAPAGSVYAAVVTSKTLITDNGLPFSKTNLWIDGAEIPAYSRTQALSDTRYVTGDRVYVEILGYTNSGYAHCKILRSAGQRI